MPQVEGDFICKSDVPVFIYQVNGITIFPVENTKWSFEVYLLLIQQVFVENQPSARSWAGH